MNIRRAGLLALLELSPLGRGKDKDLGKPTELKDIVNLGIKTDLRWDVSPRNASPLQFTRPTVAIG